jgi:hypothetical protein
MARDEWAGIESGYAYQGITYDKGGVYTWVKLSWDSLPDTFYRT